MKRGQNLSAAVGFGSVVVVAGLAVLAFLLPGLGAETGWMLILAAVIFCAAAWRYQIEIRDTLAEMLRQQSQADLLQAEIVQHRNEVDTLADGLDTAVFICDPKANVLYANQRATELFRFENPSGRSILAVTLSYDLEQLVLEAARLGSGQDAELNFTYPDDRVGLAKAWPESHGDRVFVSVYEITKLRRLERVRQDFVANVSHELRTPLTIIRAMAETLSDDSEMAEEKRHNYYERIVNEVDRLSMMSNDLLILSAAESNPVRKQACDVADIFRSVLNQLEGKAEDKGLRLNYEGPESLLIAANSAQMTQVALNLVDNAINYSNQGDVSVNIQDQGQEVSILVRDTGIGIASEHLPRIFERFYRVDKGRTRSTGGTGLGLSIVKHIVEAHGGRVSVDSALNQGSTFTVTLPKGSPSEADVAEHG